jgi:beta-lactamase regulating signal transducer with metallopeptidase domain
MSTWQHWIVGQVDASIVAGVLLMVAVAARHRLSPTIRSVLLAAALLRLALPPWMNSPWSEALVDLPLLDDSRFATAELIRSDAALLLFAVWAAGAACFLGRLGWQAWQARRHWMEVTIDAPSHVRERARLIAGARLPEIRISIDDAGPMAVGLRQPMIVLPASIVDLPDTALDAVLAHEIAHHARRDLAWIAAASVMSAIVWFNPLAHVIARELRSAREDGSDDWAVMRTSLEPYTYAHALLRSARLVAEYDSPIAAGAHPMGTRLRRLLDGSTRRDDRPGPVALTAVLVILALAIPGAHMPDPDDRDDQRVVVVVIK